MAHHRQEKKLRGKALISVVLRVAWNANIHCIWKERNRRLHGKSPRSMASVLDCVIFTVQIATCSIKNVIADAVNIFLYIQILVYITLC